MGRARERDHAIAQPRSTEEDTTDTDDDVRKDVKGEGTAPEVRRKEEKPKRSVKRRTIGLKELVNAQILRPGQGVISCEYKGNKLVGNLMDDGKLGLDGTDQLWDSPSSFSVMLKRRITPGRKADDGWKSLKYHGVLLELLKKRYFDGLGPLDEAAPSASGKLLGGLGAAQGQRASKRKAGDAEPGAGGADAAACGPSADASPEAAAGAAADAGAPAGGRWAVVGGRSPRSKMARRAPSVADGTQQQAEVPSIECSRGESAGSDSYDAEGELLKVLGLNERARRQPFKPPEMRSSSDGKEAVGVDQGRPPFPLAVRHLAGAPMNAPGEAAAEFASSGRRSSGEASPAARGSSAAGGGAGNGGGGSGAGGGEEPNSSGRPRRSARIPQRKSGGMGMDSEHSMVQCTGYQGRPGDGKAGSQPFQIFVHPRVELLMDLHSHLHLNEVIGLLAGKFNVRRRTLHIFSAFPVREMDTEEARINVEMDPADQVRVRGEMEACGWDPIGWYHSHPTFPAIPSVIDCFNQYNQQCAHRWSLGQEPYIAAIVAPYDRRLPGTRSMISWFYVDHPTDLGPLAADQNPLEVGCRPFELKVESMLDPNNSSFNIVREFDTVLSWYRRSKHRVALEEPWKDGYNKLGKMVASTASRLPARISHDVRVQYGRILEKLVLQRWFSAKAMADAPPPCASPPRRPGRPRKHPLPSATAAAASIAGVKPAAGAALPLATPRPPPGSLGGGSEWQQPPQPVSHGLKLRLTGLSSSSPIVAAVSRPDGSSLGSLGLVGSAPQLSAAPPPPPLPSTVPSPISLAAAAVAASGLAAAGLVAPAPQPAAAGAGSAANGTSPAVGAATPASLPSSQAPSQTTQQAADGVSAQ